MISRHSLLLIVAMSTGCVSVQTPFYGFDMLELPAPHACRAYKSSVVVGIGGLVTVVGLAINDIEPDDSPLAAAGLVAAIGGGIATGLTSRGCFRQMSQAAEREGYRPPKRSPEQQTQLDAVRAQDQETAEPIP